MGGDVSDTLILIKDFNIFFPTSKASYDIYQGFSNLFRGIDLTNCYLDWSALDNMFLHRHLPQETHADKESKRSPYNRGDIWLLLYQNINNSCVFIDCCEYVLDVDLCWQPLLNASLVVIMNLREEIGKGTRLMLVVRSQWGCNSFGWISSQVLIKSLFLAISLRTTPHWSNQITIILGESITWQARLDELVDTYSNSLFQ